MMQHWRLETEFAPGPGLPPNCRVCYCRDDLCLSLDAFQSSSNFFPADSIKTVYHRTANRIATPDPRKHSTQCVRPPGARILLMEIFYQNMCKCWLPLIYIHFVSGMCSVYVWNLRVAGQHSGGRLVFQTGSVSAAFHQRGGQRSRSCQEHGGRLAGTRDVSPSHRMQLFYWQHGRSYEEQQHGTLSCCLLWCKNDWQFQSY